MNRWCGFGGAANEILAETDPGVRVGQVAIQCQRLFAFGNGLGAAVGKHLDDAQKQVGHGMARRERQCPGCGDLGGCAKSGRQMI